MNLQCPECKYYINNCNFEKHIKICHGKPSWFVRNKNNPNHKIIIKKYKFDNYNWPNIQYYYDSGYTFMDVCNEFKFSTSFLSQAIRKKLFRTRKRTDTARQRGKYKNYKHTPESRAKISKKISEMILSGELKTGLYKRCNHISWLGNIEPLHSSWEKKVADFLDIHKITWTKSRFKFPYIHNGKNHFYLPDFYLKDLNVYIEVKGQVWPKDFSKWSQFTETLLIINQKHINNLEDFFIKNKLIK